MTSPELVRIAAITAAGLLAFGVSLWTGYATWRRWITSSRKSPVAVQRPAAGVPSTVPPARAVLPFLAGLLFGLFLLGLGARLIAPGDRFYTGEEGLWIAASAVLALLLLFARAAFVGSVKTGKYLLAALVLEFLAAGAIVAAGIKFTVLGFAAAGPVELGVWAAPLTILWLMAATWAVRLLDGLDGAAPVLLLTSAVAVLVGTRGTNEFVLAAFAVVVIGAVLGSLRFHFFPARLPLRGSATAIFGFVFAVLTVLARQKTVALLLLIFPLAVLVLLLGGAMLNMLERTLLLPESETEETEPAGPEAMDDPRD